MAKNIIFEQQAREALKNGIDKVANAVKVTLGPRGRNVAIERSFGPPTITNDGVSIAKEIELKDRFENMGAEIIKEVANKVNDTAGDGTTTASILTQAIVAEGLRHTTMGLSAMGIRLGIERASEDAVKALREMSKEIDSDEDIRNIAKISSESEELGKIIAETIKKVGKDGVVTVEESQSIGIESDVVQGLEFDKGYISPYMITDSERMESEYTDVPILVTDKKIAAIKDIVPLLEKLAQTGKKDLVIIADDVEGEALTTFVLNKLRGGFNVLAVKAPGFGDKKKDMLQDIAITVGATVVSEETGMTLESADMDTLGKAGRVVSNKDKTLIVGGKGAKADVATRVEQIKKQIKNTSSKYDKEKLQDRVAKLSGGVAVIRVGAATETEMKYLKLKIEDAVNATRAAIEEGIVAGGGSALVKVADKLGKKDMSEEMEEIEVGYNIVIDALDRPLMQIVTNAGKGDGMSIVEMVRKGGKYAGYDALNDEKVVDMLKEGIIDPLKVTRSVVQHAASAAAMLLTTEVAIAEEPRPESQDQSMGGGMPGMGM